jgi:hypothetical protein
MENIKTYTPLRIAVNWLIKNDKIQQDSSLCDIFMLSPGTISKYLTGDKPGKQFVRKFENYFKINLKDFENKRIVTVKESDSVDEKSTNDLAFYKLVTNHNELIGSHKMKDEIILSKTRQGELLTETNGMLVKLLKEKMDAGKPANYLALQQKSKELARYLDLFADAVANKYGLDRENVFLIMGSIVGDVEQENESKYNGNKSAAGK